MWSNEAEPATSFALNNGDINQLAVAYNNV